MLTTETTEITEIKKNILEREVREMNKVKLFEENL